MRTFTQKTKATQQTTSAKSTKPDWAHFGQSREVSSILHLQRTIGNRAVQRLLQANIEELEAGSTTTRIQRNPAVTRLVFTLPSLRVQRLSEEEMGRRFSGRDGYFDHHGRWGVQDDVLTITFRPTIYLKDTLDRDQADDVETHERGHLRDFRRLAQGLRRDLRRDVRRGNLQWEEVQRRWSRFVYEYCEASSAFHQQHGEQPEVCSFL